MKFSPLLIMSILVIGSTLYAITPTQAQTFYMTASPTAQHVRAGQFAYFAVRVYSVAGFEQPVTLSAPTLGAGFTASFNPAVVTPPKNGYAYSSLSVLVSSGYPAGSVPFYVQGTGGGVTQQTPSLSLSVIASTAYDYSLYVGTTQITAGSYGSVFVSATVQIAYTGPQTITFGLPDPPPGLTGTFSPNPITLQAGVGYTNSSTLTLYVASTAQSGTYYFAITASNTSITRCVLGSVSVLIPDFEISSDPTSRSIKQGESTEYTITAESVAGFTGTVALTKSWVTTAPSGITAEFDTTSIVLAAYGSGEAIVSITTTTSATIGTHRLKVTGTSGTKTHFVEVQLTVSTGANFTLSVQPASQTVNRGASQTFTVTVTSVGGFNKPVYLSLSGHQTGVTYDFNPNPVTPPSGGSTSSTLTVYASSTASLETRTLTITASAPDPGITHTGTVSLTVAGKTDTSISCSLSVSTIRQGQNVTISGSITPNPGANNDVILEYSADGGSTWGTITTIKTDSAGSFSHVWSPGQGNYKVRSRWDGSATYNGATSAQQSLTVQPPGCVIATATYGSELSPEVQFLRGFRDGTVMSTFAGSEFMKAFNAWYYSFSPYIADFISKQPLLKEAMKILLYPLIGILHISALTYSALSFNPELAIVATGLVASSFIGVIYFAPLSLITLLCMKRHRKFRLNPSHFKGLTAIWIASIVLICLAEATATQPVMMAATAMLVLSTLALIALTTTQRIIQKFT